MKNTEKKDEDLVKIVQPLVDWYRENKRDLPWRHNPDAYRVWISEIMLQQTRVEAVKGYYDRFLKALPTVKDLAEAEEDKLLKLWEGLGYYNRVRNMQKAAQQIMVDHEGIFPDNYEEILQLKGIGNYTAGAISAFAYGIPKPAVDGNVLRVISRITGSYEDIIFCSVPTHSLRFFTQTWQAVLTAPAWHFSVQVQTIGVSAFSPSSVSAMRSASST